MSRVFEQVEKKNLPCRQGQVVAVRLDIRLYTVIYGFHHLFDLLIYVRTSASMVGRSGEECERQLVIKE